MRCKNCGQIHAMGPLPIGVRSLLFALKKIDLLDDQEFANRDKDWKARQRRNRLDSLGNRGAEVKRGQSCQ